MPTMYTRGLCCGVGAFLRESTAARVIVMFLHQLLNAPCGGGGAIDGNCPETYGSGVLPVA